MYTLNKCIHRLWLQSATASFLSKQQLAQFHMMVLEHGYGLVAGRQDIRDLHVRLGLGLVRTAGICPRGVMDFLRVSSQDGLER